MCANYLTKVHSMISSPFTPYQKYVGWLPKFVVLDHTKGGKGGGLKMQPAEAGRISEEVSDISPDVNELMKEEENRFRSF